MNFLENYILERRPVKHARIRVNDELKVRIIIPEHFSESDIQALIQKKRSWIKKAIDKFSVKTENIKLNNNHLLLLGEKYQYFYSPSLHNRVIINQEHKTINSTKDLFDDKIQVKWYKSEARKYFASRVPELSLKHGFSYNRLFIRDQRTKWGNCSLKKNLSFNWKLIKTPQYVIDYMILHELVHTETMNHSNKFWAKVKRIIPEYYKAIDWLENYGKSL